MIDDSILMLKAIGERSRLLIVDALLEGPKYVESIAKGLQLSPATVSLHLKKLEKAGFVSSVKEQYYTVYSLNREIMETRLIDLVRVDKEEKDKQRARMEDYRQNILSKHMRNGTVYLPKQRKKRMVILREIADRYFEREKDYTEKDVNHVFVDIGIEDFCFARRSMIDERIMSRENGVYRVLGAGE